MIKIPGTAYVMVWLAGLGGLGYCVFLIFLVWVLTATIGAPLCDGHAAVMHDGSGMFSCPLHCFGLPKRWCSKCKILTPLHPPPVQMRSAGIAGVGRTKRPCTETPAGRHVRQSAKECQEGSETFYFQTMRAFWIFFPLLGPPFSKHVKKLKIPRPPNHQPKPPHKPMLKICSTCKSEFVWEMGKCDKMGLASSQKTPRFGMVLCRSSSLPLGCDGDACDSKRIWPWSMAGARRTSSEWCSKLQRICWRYAFPSRFFVIGWKPVFNAYQAIFL